MRWLVVGVLLAACNAGGLAPIDGSAGDDDPRFDGAVIDAPVIDGAILDADLHDAAIHDAEIHDAEVIPDAEVHDAEPAPDAHDPTVPSLTIEAIGDAGTYSVTPEGAPCGVGCTMYAEPTEVTITLSLLGGAGMTWGLGPCNTQGHQLTCTTMVDGEVIQPVYFFCPTYVVDVVHGDDDNPGNCHAPFRTVTKAASVALGFQIIRVLPGTYDDATETFPITIPEGTPLWGNEGEQGAGVIISTTSAVGALACSSGSDLAGLTVAAPAGVAITAASTCTIRDSLIRDSEKGVVVSAAARVERNRIRDNDVGVRIQASGADLGTASAAGGNEVVCNDADVSVADGVTATAVGNQWDHAPPDGGDVVLGAGASLDVSDATLSAIACP